MPIIRKEPLAPSYAVSYFKTFSPMRLKAVALCAEVGLPLYKIHHSLVIGDVALLMAREVIRQTGADVNLETVEIGAVLHDVGISQESDDASPEHAYVGGQLARAAGFSEEIARSIELHDCGGFVKEVVQELDLPRTVNKDDLLPETWEDKLVSYADLIISLEGESKIDVWNDETGPARGIYPYMASIYQHRRGLLFPTNHPQLAYVNKFNKEMVRFAPRDQYETLRPQLDRMVRSIRAAGLTYPFAVLERLS